MKGHKIEMRQLVGFNFEGAPVFVHDNWLEAPKANYRRVGFQTQDGTVHQVKPRGAHGRYVYVAVVDATEMKS